MKFSRPYRQDDWNLPPKLQGVVNADWWGGHAPRTLRVDYLNITRDASTETYLTVSPEGFDYRVLDTETMQVGQVIEVLAGVDFNEFDFGEPVKDERPTEETTLPLLGDDCQSVV